MPRYRTLLAAALALLILAAPATPALAAQPAVPSGLVITQTDMYVPSAGAFTHIVGQIENQGAEAIGVKTIAVSLIAPDGSTVGAANAFTKPSMLEPGQRSGWLALIQGGMDFPQHSMPPSVHVDVEAGPAQPAYVSPITHELRLEGVTVHPPAQYSTLTRIVGQVVNTSPHTIQRPHIIGSIIQTAALVPEADGDLVDVGGAGANLETLAPGESAPFQITLNQGGNGVARGWARYELYAEARLAR